MSLALHVSRTAEHEKRLAQRLGSRGCLYAPFWTAKPTPQRMAAVDY